MSWQLFGRRNPQSVSPFKPTLEVLEDRLVPSPVLTVPGSQTNSEGQSVSLAVTASDSTPGATLTFSASILPEGLSINPSTGLITGYVGYGNASPGSPANLIPFLSVTDAYGSASGTLSWTVNDVNRLPTIPLQTVSYGQSISLDLHATDLTGTDSLTYSAGNLPAGLSLNASTGLLTGLIGYTNAGNRFLDVTLTDDHGGTDTREQTWAIASWSGSEGQSLSFAPGIVPSGGLTFTVSGLPAGLSLNPSSGVISGIVGYNNATAGFTVSLSSTVTYNGSLYQQTWTIADTNRLPSIGNQTNLLGDAVSLNLQATDNTGTNSLTYQVSNLPPGLSLDPSTGLLSGAISLNAAHLGSSSIYTPTVTLSDNHGGLDTRSFSWTISSSNAINLAPLPDQNNKEGDSVSWHIVASDSNAGATLTYSVSNLPAGLSVNATSGVISGTIALGAGNSVSYVPTVTAQDGTASNSSSFTWNVASAITITPLLDRFDKEGATVALQVHASDATSGATLTYSASNLPTGLSISSTSGLISGTVALGAGNAGGTTPTITVQDANSSTSAVFNWSVSSPITITPLLDQTSKEGATVALQIHATDATSGATLTYTASNLPTGLSVNSTSGLISGTIALGAGNAGGTTPTITVQDANSSTSAVLNWSVSSPLTITPLPDRFDKEGATVALQVHASDATSGATLTYSASNLPTGLSISSTSGLISGTVALGAGNAGGTTPTITVQDANSSTSTVLNWSVSSPITITPLLDQSTKEGATVALQIHATDATSGATLTYSVSGLPTGLSISSTSGLISGTVSMGAASPGFYSPTLVVKDASSSVSFGFNWSIASAITITPLPDQTSNEGATVALQVHASDATSGATLNYAAQGLPIGLSINTSGLISGTVAVGAGNLGGYTPVILVSDGSSITDASLNWNINTPITFTPLPDQTNNEGNTVSLQVHASDATSGATLTYSAAGLPLGLSIISSSGLISGTVAFGAGIVGSFSPVITATDGTSSAMLGFIWSINSPITFTPLPDQTSNEGNTITLQVHASDATSGTTLTYQAAGLPQGLSINSSSGLITGTIALGTGNLGGFAPIVTASDGTSSAMLGFNWSINSPITFTPLPDQTSNEGNTITLQVHASDATSGTTLTYQAAGLPQGLSINSSSGLITGTIALGTGNLGGFAPIVTATDGTSSAMLGFNWSINSAITLLPLVDRTDKEGATVSLQLNVLDATSGATLSYGAAGLPSGLSINGTSGLISGTIALGAGNLGGFTPTITVSDGTSSATAGFNWSISSAVSLTLTNQLNSEGDTISLQVSASDATSGATLTYGAAGLPTGLNINASSGLISGTIATGAANLGSPYTPVITATDGTSSASVAIAWGINSAIKITALPGQTSSEGQTISLQVSASDATSGATLTYSISGLPTGLSISSTSGLISGTIALGAAGLYAPVVLVSDATSSKIAGFNWSVNSAISLTAIPDQTNSEGSTVSLQVSATDATSGATLTYSAAGLPTGLSINASSGLISGTVAMGAGNLGGLFSPTVLVSDGTSSQTAGFNWSVHSAISITALSNQTTTEGNTVSLQVSASDATSGATLTCSMSGLPTGLSINASSGLITGTVVLGAGNLGGLFTPTVLVSDGTSSDEASLTWTVNPAISLTSIADQISSAGGTVSLQIQASDATSGATLTYHVAGLPSGLSLNPTSGLVSGVIGSGQSNGLPYTPLVTVTDGTSSVTQGFTWSFGPLVKPDSYSTQENASLTVNASLGILSNDSAAAGHTLTANLFSGPSHGTLSLSADGSFVYTPKSNWWGTDQFFYTASDGTVSSPPTTVTIQVGQTLTQPNNDYDAVATGDFNGDGNVDIAAANKSTNKVDVFLGTGDGTFQQQPSVSISVGTAPDALVAGDFGNGAVDLAVANSGDGTVMILLNDGNGSFTVSQTLSVGSNPVALALGDFEGNGHQDLAVANKGSNTVSVFLNDGTGTFTLDTTLTVGTAPTGVAAADLNNDGADDLIVSNSGDNNISVLLNNGDGTFAAAVNYAVGTAPSAVVAWDADDDGTIGVAVTNSGSGTVSVLLGNGDGTLGTAINSSVGGSNPVALALVGFNSDGTPDLVVADKGSSYDTVLVNDGNGDLTVTQTIAQGLSADAVAVANVNGTPYTATDGLVTWTPLLALGGLVLGQEGAKPQIWSVDRTAPRPVQDRAYAPAVPGDPNTDTIADLANLRNVGLDASQFASWLTVKDKNGKTITINWQNGDEKLSIAALQTKNRIPADAQFFVPNRIVAYWGGEAGKLGAAFVNWQGSIQQLEKRGFSVTPFGYNQAGGLARPAVTPMKAVDVKNMLEGYGKSKQLAGVYIWGHGVDFGDMKTFGFLTNGQDFGNLANVGKALFGWIKAKDAPKNAGDYILRWDQISLPYKLGVTFVFTCFGANGVTALASPNAPLKYGIAGVLFPVGVGNEVKNLLMKNYDPQN